ncbi:MAG: hypothetical protein ACFFDN_14985 [Candidatus Hodarchaeota archaeon]
MENIKLLNKPENALIFGYLIEVNEDYGYGIMDKFTKGKGKDRVINKEIWDKIEGYSFLKYPGKINEILNELEENNIILFTKEVKIKGKTRKYFKPNVEIFIFSDFIAHYFSETTEWIKKKLNDFLFRYKVSKRNAISDLNQWLKFDYFMLINQILAILEEMREKGNLSSPEMLEIRKLLKYFIKLRNWIITSYYRKDIDEFLGKFDFI